LVVEAGDARNNLVVGLGTESLPRRRNLVTVPALSKR
jgi:hypothetical protein